jgi:methyl-accepting chemotaxis protein
MANYTWIAQLVGILASIIITVATTSWRVARIISKHEYTMSTIFAEHQLLDTKEFGNIRYDIVQTADRVRDEFGETVAAVRQDINTLALTLEENKTSNLQIFARRESLLEINKDMLTNIKELGNKIDHLTVQVVKIISSSRARN